MYFQQFTLCYWLVISLFLRCSLFIVYVTRQLRHSLVVHPVLGKILDPPLYLEREVLRTIFLSIVTWIDWWRVSPGSIVFNPKRLETRLQKCSFWALDQAYQNRLELKSFIPIEHDVEFPLLHHPLLQITFQLEGKSLQTTRADTLTTRKCYAIQFLLTAM